jgi:hypothetical protein
MIRLFLESYLLLLRIEWLMCFGNLQSIYAVVRSSQARSPSSGADPGIHHLCHAIDLACVFYGRKVLCLQRSAATTLLLRRYGQRAEMVIGAQTLPFKSHAWVEIDGNVVNDKPYMLEIYKVLDRC